MGNTILTPTAVTKEALRILHNNLRFTREINKDYDKDTEYGGQKRGATLKIRLPNQYTVRSGWTMNAQETTEQSEDLVVATVRGVDMIFTDAELAQSLDNFSKRILSPAVQRLASEIDAINFETAYKSVFNLVGSAGTIPSAALTYLNAAQKIKEFANPTSDLKMIVNPAAEAAVVNANLSLQNPAANISKQFTEGQIARALGFDWYMSQNVPVHTCGSRTNTTPVVATTSVIGASTLAISGAGNAVTYAVGDVFTIGTVASGVYAVNPETKRSTGSLQQFVVTALLTTETDGTGTLSFAPAVYASGPLQNVSQYPTQNMALTHWGTASTAYAQNLAFHPDFCTFATAKLELPGGVDFAGREVMDGISIRVVRDWDQINACKTMRLDVLCGIKVVRASAACRVTG